MKRTLLLSLAGIALGVGWCVGALAAPADSPAKAAGLVLQALPAEDLDAIERESGYRVGVQVAQVTPGSPAEKAGLKPGNILLAVGEKGVDSPQAVDQALAGKSGPVELVVVRMNQAGELEVAKVTLSLAAGGGSSVPPAITPAKGSLAQASGLTLQALSKEDLDAIQAQTGYRVGVLVLQVEPGSAAEKAGIRGQDVLLTVGRQGVDSPAAVEQALAGQAAVEILLMRPGQDKYEAVKVTLQVPAGAVPAPSGKPSEIASKLQALEAAHQAGVLSDEEYARKKAELEAQLPTAAPSLDEATQKKLQALEAAHQAGVLSDEEYARKKAELMGGAAGGQAVVGPTGGSAVEGSPLDPVNAYFDMLDFVRTQAWGRPSTTSAADRQRVAALLQEAEAELDPQVKAAIEQIPQAWAALRQRWAEASAEKRAEQREFWRKQLLLPNQILAPPERTETFHSKGDTVVFDYPADWIQAQTEGEGTQLLYLGPPGPEASWQQVLDGATSPPGALFAIAPLEEVRGMAFLEAARSIARQFVTGGAPAMEEVQALKLEKGALVCFIGHFPGQTEEKFYWLGVVPFGSEHFLAGRFGGPSAQAETLLPAFLNMLATLELKSPDEDVAGLAVNLATSIIGNAVVSTSW